MTDLADLSIKELEAVKRQRYEEAQRAGIPAQVATVARELGQAPSVRYGPKYCWKHEDISVYVDDYGSYMTVHLGERKVCSTHDTERLYIPGPWVEAVLAFYPEAEARIAAREQQRQDERRKRLLAELGAE